MRFGSDDPLNATYFPQLVGAFDRFDTSLDPLNSATFTDTISFDVFAISSVALESIDIAGASVLAGTILRRRRQR